MTRSTRNPAIPREKLVQFAALGWLLLLGGLAFAGPYGVLAWGEGLSLLDKREAQIAALEKETERLENLVVQSGERKMTIRFADLKEYKGERAQRGAVLPRGWRKVDRLDVE